MPVMNATLSVAMYLVPPLLVVWGWTRLAARPKPRTLASNSSLLGFILATASTVLAVSSIAYAQVHHFPYYDPLLLRIFAWGALLSIAGSVLESAASGKRIRCAGTLPSPECACLCFGSSWRRENESPAGCCSGGRARTPVAPSMPTRR